MAMTKCLLLEVRRDDFLEMVKRSPRLGVKILMKRSELLVSRLRQAVRIYNPLDNDPVHRLKQVTR